MRQGLLKNGRIEGVLEVFAEWWDFKSEDITFRRGLRHGPNIVYSYRDVLDESTRYRKIERWFQNGAQQGLEKGYWETGGLKYEMMYRNGKREGIENVYYENGAPHIERTFCNDKQNGVERHYRDPKDGEQAGTVQLEIHFRDNVWHGPRRYYGGDGNIAVVTEYVNGEAYGWQTKYYGNGQIESKKRYSGGVQTGDYVYTTMTGQ
jgi:antitoxin component YwqK of YwqJK toxin-antitoxin module